MEYPVFLMMGKPGSGKDSNADLLVQHISELISIGSGKVIKDWVRHGVKHGDQEAIAYESKYEAGEYLNDQTTKRVFLPVLERMISDAGKDGAIVNGYPRTLAQVDGIPYENILGVLVLNVSDTTSFDRMLKRGRDDDTPEVIHKRLVTYENTVPPIITEYYDAGIPVYEFDGEGDLHKKVFPEVFGVVSLIWQDYSRSLVKRS